MRKLEKLAMNTVISIVLIMLTSCMSVTGNAVASSEGETIPVIVNSRTLVPIRAIIEAMNGSVGWDDKTKTASLSYIDDKITLVINSITAYLNGKSTELDTAQSIINGRTIQNL